MGYINYDQNSDEHFLFHNRVSRRDPQTWPDNN